MKRVRWQTSGQTGAGKGWPEQGGWYCKLPVSGNPGMCMVVRGYKPLIEQHFRRAIAKRAWTGWLEVTSILSQPSRGSKDGMNRVVRGYKPLVEQHLGRAIGKGGLDRVVRGAGGSCGSHDVCKANITDLGLIIALGQQHIGSLDVPMQHL